MASVPLQVTRDITEFTNNSRRATWMLWLMLASSSRCAAAACCFDAACSCSCDCRAACSAAFFAATSAFRRASSAASAACRSLPLKVVPLLFRSGVALRKGVAHIAAYNMNTVHLQSRIANQPGIALDHVIVDPLLELRARGGIGHLPRLPGLGIRQLLLPCSFLLLHDGCVLRLRVQSRLRSGIVAAIRKFCICNACMSAVKTGMLCTS
jgi:hypothetical protein